MSSGPAEQQRLRDLALLRRVRDRIDREYARPLDVEELLRRGDLSVTELVGVSPSVFEAQAAHAAEGIPPCVAKKVTRPVRNREARRAEAHLA